MYVLGSLGILFILFGGMSGKKVVSPPVQVASQQTVSDKMSMEEYENYYDKKLADILNQIQGVSDASVVINIDSTEEVVYATSGQDQRTTTQETDKSGGSRTITQVNENKQLVILKGGDQPVIIKTVKPTVRGVLVVAKGADQIKAQVAITEAIQRLLDVPPHKISIQPKK